MANVLLIVYDNGSRVPFFPQGIAYIAAQLKKDGHYVEIYSQDLNRNPDSDITDYIDNNMFDVVGLGFCAGYYQYRKCKSISDAVNKAKTRKSFKYVLGGHGPAGSPEFFKEKFGANEIVTGPGEFFLGGEHPDNVDDYEWPAYYSFNIDVYKRISWPTSKPEDFCMPVLSGRGCPYKCTFCFRMDETFRPRSPESIIEEMEFLWDRYGINHFQFSDELLMSSVKRTETLCNAILSSSLINTCKNLKWDCNGRLNFAESEILKLMKRAGCEYVNYGIEAMDDYVLERMNKKLTVEKIIKGVEVTLEAGLTPGLNMLWGNIGDNFQTLKKATDFLIKYDTCAELRTIRPVTPYPGTTLYNHCIEAGLIKDAEDFYENKHKNSDLFTVDLMDGIELDYAHEALRSANLTLYNNYLNVKMREMYNTCDRLYFGDGEFRGFRGV